MDHMQQLLEDCQIKFFMHFLVLQPSINQFPKINTKDKLYGIKYSLLILIKQYYVVELKENS